MFALSSITKKIGPGLLAVLSVSIATADSAHGQTLWASRYNGTQSSIVKFTPTIPVTPTTVGFQTFASTQSRISGLEFTPDGRLWALVQGPLGSSQQGLYSVDRATGAVTQVGVPFGLTAGEILTDLAWNPKTHRLTAILTGTSPSKLVYVVGFNLATGAMATAELFSSQYDSLFVGLTCKPDGTYQFVDIHQDWFAQPIAGNLILDLGTVLGFNANSGQGIGTEFTGANIGRTWYTAYSQTDGTPILFRVNQPTCWLTSFGALPGGASTTYGDVAAEPLVDTCGADLNKNAQVADDDFVLFAAQYNQLDCSAPAMPGNCSADLNFDAFVDDADFVLFAGAYETLLCP
ncbi:MAG: hypothetical protein K2Y21_06370 [Phycisphaerales bacterium]|nr:hypothetical protein [Phycisphaerales bacterium]